MRFYCFICSFSNVPKLFPSVQFPFYYPLDMKEQSFPMVFKRISTIVTLSLEFMQNKEQGYWLSVP